MLLGPIVPCALAVAAAALHVMLASTWAGAEDHVGAVALGWGSAIAIACTTRPLPRRGSGALEVIAGFGGYVAAGSLLVRGPDAYGWWDRLLPLATGGAIVLMYRGMQGLSAHGRELLVLGVPLVQPLPGIVQRMTMPLRETATTAGFMLKCAGFPAEVDDTFILVPNATVEVQGGCSGLSAIGQLLALAILLLVLFPTTGVKRLVVVVSAVIVGFTVNAARVAFLAVVASRAPDDFAYYERYGTGSLAFPVVAACVAAAVWWCVLRAGPAPKLAPRSSMST